MKIKGKIKITADGKHCLILPKPSGEGTKLCEANDYEFDSELNGKECEAEVEIIDKNEYKIINIWHCGQEIPKKSLKIHVQEISKEGSKIIPEDSSSSIFYIKEEPDTIGESISDTSQPKEKDKCKREQEIFTDSFKIKMTKLPSDVRSLQINDIDNFYLKFYKAARYGLKEEQDENNKFYFYNSKEDKKKNIKKFEIKANFANVNFKSINEVYLNSINSLYPDSRSKKEMIFNPDWRLIVGLGGESVYEVSMMLHHIYGFPYIPASAIKGVTRSWIITEVFGKDENGKLDLLRAEMRALKEQAFCDIFGCPEKGSYSDHDDEGKKKTVFYDTFYGKEHPGIVKGLRQGKIVFFDAFPTEPPKIEPDVMNPHYGPYYSDPVSGAKIPPGDYYNPVPVYFLTVRNTLFRFFIAIKKDKEIAEGELKEATNLNEGKKTLLNVAGYWLKRALEEHGIGAKTAVGYGYGSIS